MAETYDTSGAVSVGQLETTVTKLKDYTDGKAYTHPSYSVDKSTSTVTPTFGGKFTAIDYMTVNATGHVTEVNTKTVTLPSTVDASLLTGTIDIARLPAAALERCVVVADDTARFALTTDSVQLGDTVKVTGTNLMYMVVDTDNLGSEAGYVVYNASVTWDNVSGKVTASTETAGLMTAAMVTKLNGIESGATAVTVDDALSSESPNPVQNAVVTARLNSLDGGIEECIYKLSISGTTITYTKHDGQTTGTITIPEATTETAGAMSATDKAKLDGITMASDEDVNAMLTAVFG